MTPEETTHELVKSKQRGRKICPSLEPLPCEETHTNDKCYPRAQSWKLITSIHKTQLDLAARLSSALDDVCEKG